MTQCAVLSPGQRQFVDLIEQAERAMMVKIDEAIQETTQAVKVDVAALSFEEAAPHREYFVAVAHRALFFRLCCADPETGAAGDPALAEAILESDRNYVNHYWRAASDEGVHTHPDRTATRIQGMRN